MRSYNFVIHLEGGPPSNWAAYCPDLPGVVATGDTREECITNMREAIAFHIEGMIADGETLPEPSTATTVHVEVAA